MRVRLILLMAALASPGAPQSEVDENRRRQDLARYDHARRERARDRFYAESVPGSRSTTQYRPRYSSETQPSFVSATTLAAPKPAKKAFRRARKAAAKADIETAVEQLDRAIELYPEFAAAWTALGRIRLRTGDPEEAARALQRSIEIDADFLGPYPDLAYLAVMEDRWREVVALSGKMIRVNPRFTLGYYYRGFALLQEDELEAAEKALSTAVATPDVELFPEVHFVLGEVYRNQSAYPLAAVEYRHYLSAVSAGQWSEQAADWIEQWEALRVVEPE